LETFDLIENFGVFVLPANQQENASPLENTSKQALWGVGMRRETIYKENQ
jgi:hypothetical protein